MESSQPSYQQGQDVNLKRRECPPQDEEKTTPRTVSFTPIQTSNGNDDEEGNATNEIEKTLFCQSLFEMTLITGEAMDDEAPSTGISLSRCKKVKGEVIITTRRVLFAVQEYPEQEEFDLSLDSNLIGLFALSYGSAEDNDEDNAQFETAEIGEQNNSHEDENQVMGECLYIQFNLPYGNQPLEMYLIPSSAIENSKDALQELFDAFSHTAELNPPDDDDLDDDDSDQAHCGFDEEFFGLGSTRDIWNKSDNDDEETRREEMLNKLDNMLIIPPELELGGQFDDAVEDEDDNLL